jgi:hypothetical protein
MSKSSPAILENFIELNYPGVNLPPLWQVIYQEAIRGHHLLFRRGDVERYEAATRVEDLWSDQAITDELELVTLRLVGCADLQAMIRVIDGLADGTRQSLYMMYRRVLWMWRNYIKDQLN